MIQSLARAAPGRMQKSPNRSRAARFPLASRRSWQRNNASTVQVQMQSAAAPVPDDPPCRVSLEDREQRSKIAAMEFETAANSLNG